MRPVVALSKGAVMAVRETNPEGVEPDPDTAPSVPDPSADPIEADPDEVAVEEDPQNARRHDASDKFHGVAVAGVRGAETS